jgi:hypothetical protein
MIFIKYLFIAQRNLELAPKRAKVALRDKVESQKEKSAGEIAMKRIYVADERSVKPVDNSEENKKPVKEKKILKVVRQKFAVGGLDQDMLDWGGSEVGGKLSKKQMRMLNSEKEFSEFDPNKKLRKGGKTGNKAFKSKSKFKRRK